MVHGLLCGISFQPFVTLCHWIYQEDKVAFRFKEYTIAMEIHPHSGVALWKSIAFCSLEPTEDLHRGLQVLKSLEEVSLLLA